MDIILRLLTVTAFVFLAAVAGAFGVTANLALLWLHEPFLMAESAGTGGRMFAMPISSSGHVSR